MFFLFFLSYSWFQPDSYVDPKHCEVILPKHGLSCGISSQLSILTRDQYGALVYVSGLKVRVIFISNSSLAITLVTNPSVDFKIVIKRHAYKRDIAVAGNVTLTC